MVRKISWMINSKKKKKTVCFCAVYRNTIIMITMNGIVSLWTISLQTEDLYLQLMNTSMNTRLHMRSPHVLNVRIYISHVICVLNTDRMQMYWQSFQWLWHIKRTKAAYLCTMPHFYRNSPAKVNSEAQNSTSSGHHQIWANRKPISPPSTYPNI